MSDDNADERPMGRRRQDLPGQSARLNDAPVDDRRVPAAGCGDEEACSALLQATRLMLHATAPEEVAVALGGFVVQIGGTLVSASGDCATAMPLDLSLGTGIPVLADADTRSVARMRLGQFLPGLFEDARTAVSRLRHLQDAQAWASLDPLTRLWSRREVVRLGAALRTGDVVTLIDIDDFRQVNATGGHGRGDDVL